MSGYDSQPHEHPWWQYFFLVRGAVLIHVGDKQVHLTDMSAVMIPGGTMHRISATANCCITEVKFHLHDLQLIQQLNEASLDIHDLDKRILTVINSLIREGVESLPFYSELATHLVSEMLYLHLRQAAIAGADTRSYTTISETSTLTSPTLEVTDATQPASVKTAGVAKIVQYMDKHLGDDLSLEQLSKLFGYTPSYLCQMFANTVNTSPMRYLSLLRFNRAIDLLATSSLSVEEIAAMVGFGSVSQFWRICRAKTGLSPQQFRKNNTQNPATYISFIDNWDDWAPIPRERIRVLHPRMVGAGNGHVSVSNG